MSYKPVEDNDKIWTIFLVILLLAVIGLVSIILIFFGVLKFS